MNLCRVDPRHEKFFSLPSAGYDCAVWICGERSAAVGPIWTLGCVDPGHVVTVFESPCREQDLPVVNPAARPCGGDQDTLDSGECINAEEFGETKVIADGK